MRSHTLKGVIQEGTWAHHPSESALINPGMIYDVVLEGLDPTELSDFKNQERQKGKGDPKAYHGSVAYCGSDSFTFTY